MRNKSKGRRKQTGKTFVNETELTKENILIKKTDICKDMAIFTEFQGATGLNVIEHKQHIDTIWFPLQKLLEEY